MSIDHRDEKSEQAPDLREDEHGSAAEEPTPGDQKKPDTTPAFEDDSGEVYVDEDP